MRISDWSSDVCSSDLTLTPVEVIGHLYEAFGRGDLDALLAYVHPDVEWCQTEAGARHPVIDQGRGVGHDAVRVYFADRKRVVKGKSVSLRVDLGGRRLIQKQNTSQIQNLNTIN